MLLVRNRTKSIVNRLLPHPSRRTRAWASRVVPKPFRVVRLRIAEKMADTDFLSEAADFDKNALEKFLKENMGEFPKGDEELTISKFKSGTSNPTYHLKKGNHEFVLRQKALHARYVDLHKVHAEYNVMRALQGSIPVPKTFLYSADTSIVGSEFYLMEFIKGRIFRSPLMPDLSPVERKSIFESMVSVLANLHELDLKQLKLEDSLDFAKGDHLKQRAEFIAKLYRDQSAIMKMPNVNAQDLIDWLLYNIPDDSTAPVVLHGDVRLENMMIHETEPRVVAVLDWEGACASHPYDDLAYLCMPYYMRDTDSPWKNLIDYSAEGVPTEEELLKSYCQKRGLTYPLENWEYFIVQCILLTTCRIQGVVAGFLQQYGAIPDQLQSGFGVVYNMLSKARELVGLRAK